MTKLFTFALCVFFLTLSCKNKISESPVEGVNTTVKDSTMPSTPETSESVYVQQSTDPQTAANIKTFLTEEYLKDDLALMDENDRKFQFYKIDLNKDGNEEIFVRFNGPYFCGSGGCTLLLLDNYGEVITKFTVMRPPIFAETTQVNGWSLLLVEDAGVFKELKFENGSYPSNPSLLPKAPYDAPSGHAEVIFNDDMYKYQTYTF
jgi:hypothetical protein